MESDNKFVDEIYIKKVMSLPKREMMQNEWDKLKWKKYKMKETKRVFFFL